MPDIEPITREETYYSRAAGNDVEIPEPVTNKEHFLYALATGDTENLPEAVTREEHFIEAAAESGGGDVRVVQLTATENGTYRAPAGSAYSPVVVATSAPTISSLTATENGTYTAPEGTAYSPVYVSTVASRISVQLSIDPHDTDVTIYGPLGSGGGEIYAYTRVVPSESITSYSLSVVKNDSAYTNLCLSDGYEFVYLTGHAIVSNQGKTVQIRGEASLRIKPIDGYKPTLDPERIDGTVAVPFSMDVATEIHNKCNNSAPTAAATINVPVMGMGVLPCVVLAGGGDGTTSARYLMCGAAMPVIDDRHGMLTLLYELDSETFDPDTSQVIVTPLANVGLVQKKAFSVSTSGGTTSVTDVSALVFNSATTVTFISRYEHGQTTQPDE